jgi:ribose transport system substrate-binding protein
VVAHFDQTKARDFVKDLLKKGEKFDAVFAHNDAMILGAIEAFESEAAKPSVFVGFDAVPEALDAIKQKKLTATVAQKPEDMGRIAVQNAVKALRGEEISKNTLVDLELIKN